MVKKGEYFLLVCLCEKDFDKGILLSSSETMPHLGVAHVGAHALAAAKHVPDLDLAIQAGRQQQVPTVWIEPAQRSTAVSMLDTP